ncbi:5944_t:CDS:2, partial [Racocetra fulgida]
FIDDVKSALNATYSRDNKISELKNICQKYGHFYASEVIYGGAIIENVNNVSGGSSSHNFQNYDRFRNITSELLNISRKTLTIVGGNDALYVPSNSEAVRSWRNSVNNPKYWRIISYNIRPIFDLLDDNLKHQILETFGKKILKAGITTLPISPLIQDTGLIVTYDLSDEFQDLTSSPSQCQIFASIMNQDNCIYSLRIDYVDDGTTPVFVVHYVSNVIGKRRSQTNQHRRIQISWIIVGYPEKFMFELKNSKVEVTI